MSVSMSVSTYKKEILYILPGALLGGAEQSLKLLIEGLIAAHAPYSITILLPRGPLTKFYSALPVTLISWPFSNWFFRESSWHITLLCWYVRFRTKNKRFACVHSNSIYSAFVGEALSKIYGAPHVIHWRDNQVPSTLYPVLKSRHPILIAPSHAVAQTLRNTGILLLDIHVVLNAIDPAIFYARPDREALKKKFHFPTDRFLVGFFARLNPHKGLDILLQSFRDLSVKEFHLIVAGSWENLNYQKEIEALISREELTEKVTFLGYREDVAELLAAMDCVCAPSTNEAMPRVGLEALASGTPVLAHPVGGYQDLIQDGENGFYIPESSPEMWREKLRFLHAHPMIINTMRVSAEKSIAPYFLSDQIAQMTRLYDAFTQPLLRGIAIPISSMKTASSRIRCFGFVDYLSRTFSVSIIENKGQATVKAFRKKMSSIDFVYIQKAAYPWALEIAQLAKDHHIPLIYDIDDAVGVWGKMDEAAMIRLADGVTVDTDERAKAIQAQFSIPVSVIPDGLDYFSGVHAWSPKKMSDHIQSAVTFGWDTSCLSAEPLLSHVPLPELQKAHITNKVVFPGQTFIPWVYETFMSTLAQHDLCVLGHDHTDAGSQKSNNRLLVALAAGIPTLVTDTPAFRDTYHHLGLDFLICKNQEDVFHNFKLLNENKALRQDVIDRGRAYVMREFHPQKSSQLLEDLIRKVILSKSNTCD